jgi:hypothetical protein
MKNKRREQANSGLRDSLGDLSVRVVFRDVGVWKCVDSTCRPIEFALSVETNKIFPRQADSLDIARPNHSVFADILHNFLKGLWHGACLNMSLLNNK